MYSTVPITINLQLLNIYTPLIPHFKPTLYPPNMATQLDGVYTIKEAWYKSTSKTSRKDKQIISRFSISSTYLYKIKGAVKDIINENNIISIYFQNRINYTI